MKVATKKLKNGFELPVLGLGTWEMGGRWERNPSNNDKADVQAIKNAIRAGITHIDTAEGYANGHAEELVSEAIKGFDRKELFITSKVLPANLTYEGILESTNWSLRRLETSYLDLYLIHSPSPSTGIRETMKAMNKLMYLGLTRNIGVSNFSVAFFDEAQRNSDNKIVANQLHYNLMIREVERNGSLEYCQKNDVMLIAYRSTQKGALSKNGTNVVDEIAEKYRKTPAQIAINWLLSQDNVVALAKASGIGHLDENMGALGWNLRREDVERLRKEFPDQRGVSDAHPPV